MKNMSFFSEMVLELLVHNVNKCFPAVSSLSIVVLHCMMEKEHVISVC